MNISGLTFLFLFLPIFGVLYCVAGRRRLLVLFVATLCFGISLGLWEAGMMFLSVTLDFLLAKPIYLGGSGSRRSRLALLFCVAKDIGIFVVFSALGELSVLAMPVGVAVYCFTSLGYIVDVYNGETAPIEDLREYIIFCCFFGKINVGPIVSSSAFIPQLKRARFSGELIGQGFCLYIHGMAKLVLLAGNLAVLAEKLAAVPYADKTVLSVWLLVFCTLMQVYFTLSGYSDMARGVGAVFGLELPENFHYPLQAESVTDFFSRFNISANRFVRKYVYAALGAEDNGRLSTTLNIMLITMLMGIWYGVRLNLLLWGATLGLFIVVETIYNESFLLRLPRFLRQVYTLAAVVLSFVWYCGRSVGQSWFYLSSMLGFGGLPLINDICRYLLSTNWLLLACGAFFCTRVAYVVTKRTEKRRPLLYAICSALGNAAMLVLAIAFLV